MLFEKKEIKNIGHGSPTLVEACDLVSKEKYELAKDSLSILKGDREKHISCDEIQTKLIQETGRLCEEYAGDIISVFDELQPFLTLTYPADKKPKDERWVISVGLREYGVDLDHSIMQMLRLGSGNDPYGFVNPQNAYREILALDIKDVYQGERLLTRTIELKEITHTIIRLAKADMSEKERKGQWK